MVGNGKEVDYREHLILGEQEAYRQYDKAILSLSSGGLALSLLFIKELVNLNTAEHKGVLITAWICFTLAILTTVCSFLFSQYAFRKQIQIRDKEQTEGATSPVKATNRWVKVTQWANLFSGIFFVAAVLTISHFRRL